MPKKNGLLLIAVTGTPATGKSTLAGLISKEIGAKVIEANDIVEGKGLFSEVDSNGSKVVEMEGLARELKAQIKAASSSGQTALILVGHLLADIKLDYDIAVVTRTSLKEMIERQKRRKYNHDKIKENLVSESIDYCGVQISELSKETYEVESDDDKTIILNYIKARLADEKVEQPKLTEINKMEEMLDLVYEGNDYGF